MSGEGLGSLRLRSELTREPRSVEDTLRAYGMAGSDANVLMFYRLNPHLAGQRIVTGQTKITLLTPDEIMQRATERQGTKVSIDGDPTKAYAALAKADAIRNREMAERLSPNAFSNPEMKARFGKTLSQIESAAQALSNRSANLSGLELALAADRIEYANRKSAELNRQAEAGQALDTTKLSALEYIASFLRPIEAGERLTRKVKIVVTGSNGSPSNGLGVYSLPGPLFDDPEAYDDHYIRDRLLRYSFTPTTSPATSAVDGLDARVWVGPARRYDAMITLIRSRKLAGKYSVLNASTIGKSDVEIRLSSPSDVVSLD